MLRKTLVATLMSAAVVFTPATAAHAQSADGIDAGKLIMGAVALGVIAKALDNQRDREREEERAAAERAQNAARAQHWRQDRRGHDWNNDRGWRRGDQRHQGRRSLPANCQFVANVRGRDQRVVGENCLQKAGFRPNELPRTCTLPLRRNGSWYTVFSSRCLEQKGYRVEARWRR